MSEMGNDKSKIISPDKALKGEPRLCTSFVFVAQCLGVKLCIKPYRRSVIVTTQNMLKLVFLGL